MDFLQCIYEQAINIGSLREICRIFNIYNFMSDDLVTAKEFIFGIRYYLALKTTDPKLSIETLNVSKEMPIESINMFMDIMASSKIVIKLVDNMTIPIICSDTDTIHVVLSPNPKDTFQFKTPVYLLESYLDKLMQSKDRVIENIVECQKEVDDLDSKYASKIKEVDEIKHAVNDIIDLKNLNYQREIIEGEYHDIMHRETFLNNEISRSKAAITHYVYQYEALMTCIKEKKDQIQNLENSIPEINTILAHLTCDETEKLVAIREARYRISLLDHVSLECTLNH